MGHAPGPVDENEVKRAQSIWSGFIDISKWGIVVVVAILAFLALFYT